MEKQRKTNCLLSLPRDEAVKVRFSPCINKMNDTGMEVNREFGSQVIRFRRAVSIKTAVEDGKRSNTVMD